MVRWVSIDGDEMKSVHVFSDISGCGLNVLILADNRRMDQVRALMGPCCTRAASFIVDGFTTSADSGTVLIPSSVVEGTLEGEVTHVSTLSAQYSPTIWNIFRNSFNKSVGGVCRPKFQNKFDCDMSGAGMVARSTAMQMLMGKSQIQFMCPYDSTSIDMNRCLYLINSADDPWKENFTKQNWGDVIEALATNSWHVHGPAVELERRRFDQSIGTLLRGSINCSLLAPNVLVTTEGCISSDITELLFGSPVSTMRSSLYVADTHNSAIGSVSVLRLTQAGRQAVLRSIFEDVGPVTSKLVFAVPYGLAPACLVPAAISGVTCNEGICRSLRMVDEDLVPQLRAIRRSEGQTVNVEDLGHEDSFLNTIMSSASSSQNVVLLGQMQPPGLLEQLAALLYAFFGEGINRQ